MNTAHSPGVVISIHRTFSSMMLPALLMLSGCSWLHVGTPENSAATMPVAQGIHKVCAVDLDNRKPADSFGFSMPGFSAEHDNIIVVGARDARAHAYDLSCHEISRSPLRNSSDSGAVVLPNGLAILGDSGGMLYAIHPENGALAWQFNLSGPLTSAPVVVGQDVLVQTLDNRIYRIAADGKKQWSFTAAAGGLGMYLTSEPLVQGNKVYAVFNNGDAFALSLDSGDVLWRKQLLLNNDAAVLSEIRAPLAKPVALRKILWGNDSASNAIMFSFYQGNIMLLDADDGRLLFSHEMSLRSAPYVDGDSMILADVDGYVRALALASGQYKWELELSKSELVGPSYYDGSYWVGDIDGTVYRVSPDGKLQGTWQVDGEITRPLVTTTRGVLVRTNLGALYVLQ